MRFAKNPAFLLSLALVCAAVLIPAAAPAEGSSRFAGPWYAVSCVMDGKEYYPETWDEPLVITLGADGRFTWIGQFYDDYFGTWYCLNDSELHLLIDNEDGTPGTEEDASILMLNQEECLVYTEENGPVIIFSHTHKEVAHRPKTVSAKNADAFSGAWVAEYIHVDVLHLNLDQFAEFGGVKVNSSIVFDGLDAYLSYSTNTNVHFSVQLKMRFENGKLVQSAKTGEDIFLPDVFLTDNGQLEVHLSPNGSGKDPLVLFFTKAV